MTIDLETALRTNEHIDAYVQFLKHVVPSDQPLFVGIAFICFRQDRSAAERYRESLGSDPCWSSFQSEILTIQPFEENHLAYVLTLWPVTAEEWFFLPEGGRGKCHLSWISLLGREGAKVVMEEMRGVLVHPEVEE